MPHSEPQHTFAVVGDIHGHGQAGLGLTARWQHAQGIRFDIVLLAGDVAAYTARGTLDQATIRHNRANPIELEMMKQWMTTPSAPWVSRIFEPIESGGLGLGCPVVMVAGNHEDFAHLASITPARRPPMPVPVAELPTVDPTGRISYLPSGWTCITATGLVIGGIGGIDRQQRDYKNAAVYFDEEHLQDILDGPNIDVLLTHTGPMRTQGQTRDGGSHLLDSLVGLVPLWFHGHAVADESIQTIGDTTIVPLHGVPFDPRSNRPDDPGRNAICTAKLGDGDPEIVRLGPDPHRADQMVWYEFKRPGWRPARDRRGKPVPGRENDLVAPPLAAWDH